jgi:hypothetical protein
VQFVGRGRLSGRRLISRRLANTSIVLGVTAGGVILFGAGAVIWSAAVAELLAACLWIIRRGDEDADGATPDGSAPRHEDEARETADEESPAPVMAPAARRAADPQAV